MDKNKEVVQLCVRWAEAMKAGNAATDSAEAREHYAEASAIAREGAERHPGAALPQGTTWDGMATMATNSIGRTVPTSSPAQSMPIDR